MHEFLAGRSVITRYRRTMADMDIRSRDATEKSIKLDYEQGHKLDIYGSFLFYITHF
jgi:hypothetical protein